MTSARPLLAALFAAFLLAGGCTAITRQPGDLTVAVGEQASFTCIATNAKGGQQNPYEDSDLTYRWQRRNGSGVFQDIPGATARRYAFTATAADHGAVFRCIAFDPTGRGDPPDEEISDPAVLTVVPAGTARATALLSPAAGAALPLKHPIRFRAQGQNLVWKYDFGGSGNGALTEIPYSVGQNQVDFILPDAIPAPGKVRIQISGADGVTAERIFNTYAALAPAPATDRYTAVVGTTLTRNAAQGLAANDGDPNGSGSVIAVNPKETPGGVTLNGDGSFTWQVPATVGEHFGTYEAISIPANSSPATYYWLRTKVLANYTLQAVAASDAVPPGKITTLTLKSSTGTSFGLGWTAVGDDGTTGTATAYELRYRSGGSITDGNFTDATLATGLATPKAAGQAETFTLSGLAADTWYLIAIKAIDEAGNRSEVSNVLLVKTGAAVVDTTPPAAITTLAAGTPTGTSIPLTWTAVGDDGTTGIATDYQLRYSTAAITAANFDQATLASGLPAPKNAGGNEAFTLAGLAPATTYWIAIKAQDEVGNLGAISNVVQVTTATAGAGDPAPTIAGLELRLTGTVPAGTTAVTVGGTPATLTGTTWTATIAVEAAVASGGSLVIATTGPGGTVERTVVITHAASAAN